MAKKRFKSSLNPVFGYKMLMPATILFLLVSIYPLLNGFRLAMMNYNLLKPKSRGFIGLGNIIKILTSDKEFYGVLAYSFLYTFFVVLVSYILGLCFAMLLNKDIKFRGVFRALILIPWVIPSVVASTNWQWVLNDQIGIINTTLMNMGFISKPILFLALPELARITVIFTSAWKSFPFFTVVLLAGLQSIPKELYEAAQIDGANPLQAFRHVTLSMLRNVTLICTTLMFIWTFNNFENIYLLTQGGPRQSTFVLPILSYYTAFFRSNLGYASAISVVMLVVLMLLSGVYLRFQKESDIN